MHYLKHSISVKQKSFWCFASLLLISILLVFAVSYQAGAVDLNKITNTLAPGSQEEKPIVRPEPVSLEANWWRFFEADGETLRQRVEAVVGRLDTLLAEELSAEQTEAARPLIERIKANLQSLPNVKAQTAPEPPPPVAFAEKYTLDNVLALAQRLRQLQARFNLERDEITSSAQAIDAAKRRVDTLLAAYLTLAPSAPERVVKGLEIMAERSAVAIAEEQLRVQRAELMNLDTQIQQLEAELDVSEERLVSDQAELTQLSVDMAQARIALENAQERLIKEQARAMDVVTASDPVEAEATARYRQQRAIQAAVQEASATLRLTQLQLEHLHNALLLGMADDPFALRRQLTEWQEQLTGIGKQAELWLNTSERERQRASEAVVDDSRRLDTEPPMFYELINEDRLKLVRETLADLQNIRSQIAQLQLLIRLADEQLTRIEGGFSAWWTRLEDNIVETWDNTRNLTARSLFKIGDTPVTALGFFRVGIILVVAWILSYWLRRIMKRLSDRREGANESAYYTIGRLSHYVLMVIGLMMGLASIGVGFSNLALFAGAAAFGIGFGLQSIVNNFVSGLIILFDRSLKVGDFVELSSGIAGEVRAINVRSTVINTNDNVDIVVPNSEFMNTKVINWTLQEDYRRIHIPFGVAFDADKDLVRRAVMSAAEQMPHTLTGVPGRNPGVWLIGYGENRMDFELVVWVTPKAVKRPSAVHAAYMWEIDSALRQHGIHVPLPQRDLHLRSGFKEIFDSYMITQKKFAS